MWKFCPECGRKLEADWKFCPGCAKEIQRQSAFTGPYTIYPIPTYVPYDPYAPWPKPYITWTTGGTATAPPQTFFNVYSSTGLTSPVADPASR